MSKKFLPFLVVATLILAAVIFALPHNATASRQLGITPTEPPVTETPETPTDPPPVTKTSKPKKTEVVVLLPATGEGPLDSSQGMQWFFVIGIIFLIGFILIRELRGVKIQK